MARVERVARVERGASGTGGTSEQVERVDTLFACTVDRIFLVNLWLRGRESSEKSLLVLLGFSVWQALVHKHINKGSAIAEQNKI